MHERQKNILIFSIIFSIFLVVCFFIVRYSTGAGAGDTNSYEIGSRIKAEQQRNLERAKEIHSNLGEIKDLNERAGAINREAGRTIDQGKEPLQRIGALARRNEQIFQRIFKEE